MNKWFMLATALYCSSSWASSLECSPQGANRLMYGCSPVVFVVRHAEDTSSGPHQLTEVGKNHAALYVKTLDEFIYGNAHRLGGNATPVCVCPIKKIISISHKQDERNDLSPRNPNPNPSANPYETLVPIAKALGLSINTDNGMTQYWSSFQWTSTEKLRLLGNERNNAQFSVLLAWDKQGMNPTKPEYGVLTRYLKSPEKNIPFEQFTPLLKAFPKRVPSSGSESLSPAKTFLWVYSNQASDGTFEGVNAYKQFFYSDATCTQSKSYEPSKNSRCITLEKIQ